MKVSAAGGRPEESGIFGDETKLSAKLLEVRSLDSSGRVISRVNALAACSNVPRSTVCLGSLSRS